MSFSKTLSLAEGKINGAINTFLVPLKSCQIYITVSVWGYRDAGSIWHSAKYQLREAGLAPQGGLREQC